MSGLFLHICEAIDNLKKTNYTCLGMCFSIGARASKLSCLDFHASQSNKCAQLLYHFQCFCQIKQDFCIERVENLKMKKILMRVMIDPHTRREYIVSLNHQPTLS